MSSTILDMKKQIYERIKHAFPRPEEERDDEWINQAIWLYIKDNTPYVEGRRNTQSK